MPLHDWTDRPGWEGVHHLWIAELLHWIKPRLPEGYRAYIGSSPVVAIGDPEGSPDVSVRQWTDPQEPVPTNGAAATTDEPDEEVAVVTLDPGHSLFVAAGGRLVAAVELISPRNKDRPAARATYTARYAGYLLEGVHLMLVDVIPRPAGFSFADSIAQEVKLKQPPLPVPCAVSYRVGEPAATGGRFLGIWRRQLTVGARLPMLSLPLTVQQSVPVDLESTYARAAADAYLP